MLVEQGVEGCSFVFHLVKVDAEGVAGAIDFFNTNRQSFDLVIMLGVDERACHFQLELVATDAFPDIYEDGKMPVVTHRYLATSNMAHTMWLPYRQNYSFDAGSYFCNNLYYKLLDAINTGPITLPLRPTQLLPACFVHVPPYDAFVDLNGAVGILTDIVRTFAATST